MTKKERVENIIKTLNKLYPKAGCTLDYKNGVQLLVAVQLAAQCTDKRVNTVTKTLFEKYPDSTAFENAEYEKLMADIKSTGFYRNKARNIILCCKTLNEKFNAVIPDNLDDMLKLPGIGRKSANVVLYEIYSVPGIVIDTHAKRISGRLGLTKNTDPEKIEYDLMKILPKKIWNLFCHQLVMHGRTLCKARKPKCSICPLLPFCTYKP